METNLYLKRIIFTDNSTIGDLYWDGGNFECNTLEDTCRKRAGDDNILQASEKVWGETAVPAGRYEIKMQWSTHYQRKMPHLQNVPYFSGIMIHWGNFPKDTLGCIILGVKDPKAPDFVAESHIHYNEFEPKVLAALEKGQLFINIDGGYTA